MMGRVLVDTDILSFFLRGHPPTVARVRDYLADYGRLTTSVLTFYEILSGLRHRDARQQMSSFVELSKTTEILPLNVEAAEAAAEQYADLRSRGAPIDDVDLLIAGTALANGLALATHNTEHFQRVRGLAIEDWSAGVEP